MKLFLLFESWFRFLRGWITQKMLSTLIDLDVQTLSFSVKKTNLCEGGFDELTFSSILVRGFKDSVDPEAALTSLHPEFWTHFLSVTKSLILPIKNSKENLNSAGGIRFKKPLFLIFALWFGSEDQWNPKKIQNLKIWKKFENLHLKMSFRQKKNTSKFAADFCNSGIFEICYFFWFIPRLKRLFLRSCKIFTRCQLTFS